VTCVFQRGDIYQKNQKKSREVAGSKLPPRLEMNSEASNSSTQELEAEEPQVWGQPEPHKTLSQKNHKEAIHQWLTLIILATWEAEIGRLEVRGLPGQIVPETPFPK
jgi:hypothetical protein